MTKNEKMLKSYLKKIYEITNRGDAREETYYSTLEGLLQNYAESVGKINIHITPQPKKTEAGNPDFRIWDGEQHITGYVEAKAPTVEDLDQIETTEQLQRYLRTFPNVILTNFFEFRLYRNGNLIDKVLIARPFVVHKLKTIPPVEKETDFLKILEKFFSFSLPKVYDAKTLATVLATKTSFLKDEVVAQELKEEEKEGRGFILGFYEAFKQYLISGLTKEDFADLYSQTITYGLFAARIRSQNEFNRKLAYDRIPHTIGILRDVFKFVSLEDLPQQMEWIVDDISEVLAVTDVKKILHKYFHEGKGKDPIVHFYETFLAEYDPKTREKRGVYYTPEPVVSYIVRSLHNILKEHFDRKDGFASDTVTVLDPAAGTLTFLAEAAKLAAEEFTTKYGEGGKENFIKEHILKNFYAFELMMAPYAVGHLKMSFLLEELGYKLQKDDRFKLYLTNTLEMEELAQTKLPGIVASLSEESHFAGKIKKETPILVILGNPPYSGISANRSEWVEKIPPGQKYSVWTKRGLKDRTAGKRGAKIRHKTFIGEILQDYYMVDGKPLGEKNPKWLQDDYVKFIRFAQWKIDKAGEGVLGFITNHRYLDNPTFRGMRQSLMNSFNEIYILDLHGNVLKKEKCPDDSKDQNVFDIRQGVAIALLIKENELKKKVLHSELWGLREQKYNWLLQNDIETTEWKKIQPKSELYYLFSPKDEKLLKNYHVNPKITDVFPINSVGFLTHKDKLSISFTKSRLKRNIEMFANLSLPEELLKETFSLKGDISKKRKQLKNEEDREKYFIPCYYRAFDKRYICFHNCLVDRQRLKVLRHMLDINIALICQRQTYGIEFHHVFVADTISDLNYISNLGGGTVFPLYLYPDTDKKDLFSHKKKPAKRKPNISPKLFKALCEVYKKEPTPEDIFYYIYAVLYSNSYRTKYAEFLKIDFPRIPFTKDYELLNKMAEYGKRLVDLHLLKAEELDPPLAKFQGEGDEKVEKLRYDEREKRVYINQDQYFEGIREKVWQYQIGGYQVFHKWLKDRKGRSLSLDDIKHYCKIVTALQKTIGIQKAIDDVYAEVEKDTIEFDA